MAVAKGLAALFCPVGDRRPDTIISLTVAFASIANCNSDSIIEYLFDHLAIELRDTSDILIQGLVNPKMYTKNYPQLQQLVLLMQKVQKRARKNRKPRKL